MALEVVDREQRQAVHRGDRLGGDEADDQAADQARAGAGRDAGELAKAQPGLGHDPGDQPVEDLDMGARGDLGHDAAERRMSVLLAEQASASTRRSPSTSAAAVSSQLVSIPSTTGGALCADGCRTMHAQDIVVRRPL